MQQVEIEMLFHE